MGNHTVPMGVDTSPLGQTIQESWGQGTGPLAVPQIFPLKGHILSCMKRNICQAYHELFCEDDSYSVEYMKRVPHSEKKQGSPFSEMNDVTAKSQV